MTQVPSWATQPVPNWTAASAPPSRPCTCQAIPRRPQLWLGVTLAGWVTGLGALLLLSHVPMEQIAQLFGMLGAVSAGLYWALTTSRVTSLPFFLSPARIANSGWSA